MAKTVELSLQTVKKLSGYAACQFLSGFTDLIKQQCLRQPFQTEIIRKLLYGLLKKPTNEKIINDGLYCVIILMNYQALTDVSALFPYDTDLFDRLLYEPTKKKTAIADKAIRIQIAKKMAYLCHQIHAVSLTSISISAKALIQLLTIVGDVSPHERTQVLFSVGQMRQAGLHTREEPELRKIVGQHIAKLNIKKIADGMSLSDLALTLYTLVLPKSRDWIAIKPTANLVSAFHRKLEKLPYPLPLSCKFRREIQQVAEYLCLAGQEMTPLIAKHLQTQRPTSDKQLLQHCFLVYLKEQAWFQQQYEIVKQGTPGEEIEEELLFGFARVDFVVRNKKTDAMYIVEVDGPRHKQRVPQDGRRDAYLRTLKKANSDQLLFKDIIRLPVDPLIHLEDMERSLYGRLENQFDQEIQKLSLALNQSVAQLKTEEKPPKIPKINYKISIAGLKQAIQAKDIDQITKLVHQLISRNTFKSDQEKAEILKYTVKQHRGPSDKANETIIKRLVNVLGQRIMTTDHAGQSPLQVAIEENNETVINIFVVCVIPEKFKDRSFVSYPQWQRALQFAERKKRKNIAKRLKAVGVSLPEKTTLPINTPLSAQETKAKDKSIAVLPTAADLNQVSHAQPDNPQWTEQQENLARSDDAKAQYLWAIQLFYDPVTNTITNIEKFLYWIKLSAAQYAPAQVMLGYFYLQGIGVTKTETEAFKLFKVAAEQNNQIAQLSLGMCFAEGRGVTQDFKAAVLWYLLAAEQGNQKAQCNLGTCYAQGNGVAQNFEAAVYWYHLAAKQGNRSAQFHLGLYYYQGKGVTQDFKVAVSWFQMAAGQGSLAAQCNLGSVMLKATAWLKTLKQQHFGIKWQHSKEI